MSACNYYEVLMVTRDAAPEVIRAAYKVLTQKWHLDRNSHESALEIMALLNRAYDELSDPGRRQEYDEWLAETESAPEPPRRGAPFVVDEDKVRPAFEKLEKRRRWELSPLQKRILLTLITGGILGGLT